MVASQLSHPWAQALLLICHIGSSSLMYDSVFSLHVWVTHWKHHIQVAQHFFFLLSLNLLSGVFSLVLHVYEPRPSVHLDGSVLKQGDVTEGLLSRIYTYKFSW